jgi:hypothetical protein
MEKCTWCGEVTECVTRDNYKLCYGCIDKAVWKHPNMLDFSKCPYEEK